MKTAEAMDRSARSARAAPTLAAGPGRPIEAGPLAQLEHRFGRSLGDVRVHTGPEASAAAKANQALAFTVGRDIAFGEGRYRPESAEGLELLAHEVAHTVQQEGVPRGVQPRRQTLAGSALERQAHEAARVAVHGPSRAGVAGERLTSRATEPVVSFLRDWTGSVVFDPPYEVPAGDGVVARITNRADEPGGKIAAFRVERFVLPADKGPYKERYDQVAAAGLEATVDAEGRLRSGAKEDREDTPVLRKAWLEKVGWSSLAKEQQDAAWYSAGGTLGTAFKDGTAPQVAGKSIDWDHVLELQLGGSNDPQNIAPAESGKNQASGRKIWAYVAAIAKGIAQRPETKVKWLVLSFASVDQAAVPLDASPAEGSALEGWDVDAKAANVAAAASRRSAIEAGGSLVYEVTTGIQDAIFQVGADPTQETNLQDDANRLQAQLIANLQLDTLNRAADPHRIAAKVRTAPATGHGALPITLTAGEAVVLTSSASEGAVVRRLTLEPGDKLKFTYPYLSEGWMQLSVDNGSLQGRGELVPSIPLLSKTTIGVFLADGQFGGTLNAKPADIWLPVPGFECTACKLDISLAPEFSAVGTMEFTIGDLVTGRLEVVPSTTGIRATGTLAAALPGLESATGTISYADGHLSGMLELTTEQLKGLPGSPSGTLRVDLDDAGVRVGGALELLLPDGTPVSLAVATTADGYLFTGSTKIELPRLDPLILEVTYDGSQVSGKGKTGLTYKGISGEITIAYADGLFSGEGAASFKRGSVAGSGRLHLSSTGKVWGDLTVTFPLVQGLTATAGARLSESGVVTVRGEIALPPQIVIFDKIEREKKLFTFQKPIDVYPPLQLLVNAGAGFALRVGPATIDGAKVSAEVNPFEQEKDFLLRAEAALNIPAFVGVTVTIGAGPAVGLGPLVSIGGTLNVDGMLGVEGAVHSQFLLEYGKGRFEAAADLGVSASPVFEIGLSASIIATIAGMSFDWTWPIGDKLRWGSSFTVGIVLPVRYESDKPFELPDLSKAKLTYPEISVERLMADLWTMTDQ